MEGSSELVYLRYRREVIEAWPADAARQAVYLAGICHRLGVLEREGLVKKAARAGKL
jgi:hypothetical protein